MIDDSGEYAQLRALAQVMNEIVGGKVPLVSQENLYTRKVLRELREQRDNYLLDDGELCDVIDQAILELRTAQAIIIDLRKEYEALDQKNSELSAEVARLEKLAADA